MDVNASLIRGLCCLSFIAVSLAGVPAWALTASHAHAVKAEEAPLYSLTEHGIELNVSDAWKADLAIRPLDPYELHARAYAPSSPPDSPKAMELGVSSSYALTGNRSFHMGISIIPALPRAQSFNLLPVSDEVDLSFGYSAPISSDTSLHISMEGRHDAGNISGNDAADLTIGAHIRF